MPDAGTRCEAAIDGSTGHSRPPGPHIAVFLRSLGGGGAERMMLNLVAALVKRGHQIDLVLCRTGGVLEGEVPTNVRVVLLKPSSGLFWRLRLLQADPRSFSRLLLPLLLSRSPAPELPCLPDLIRYLRRSRPAAMLSALNYANLAVLWAQRIAGTTTRIVISERSTLSMILDSPERRGKRRWRLVQPLAQRLYPGADAIVAVSDGMADDLACTARLPRSTITTVYNPVVSETLFEQAREDVAHPWFASGEPPVILGVGRLAPEKDFPTLLRAFARLRQQREARLVILGEGKGRPALERLARELGIADAVDMPGFVANPFAYMARASLFVLSSVFEGLPGALIEALACGCPVVSTDCPSGPAEILENGRWGPLVPMGDDAALAEAMLATLAAPLPRARLRERGAFFSVERAAERYCALLLGSDLSSIAARHSTTACSE